MMTELELRQRLCAWFECPLGRSLQATEAHHLRNVLSQLYGKIALQLGWVGKMDLLDASHAPTQAVLDLRMNSRKPSVCGAASALPFDTKSVDLVLLPHTLDFSSEPHQVLREVHRVLTPEGHIVILGFNPLSLWGLWRLAARRRGIPWCGQFISLLRLKDWLALLDFELTHGSMLYYRPPLQHEGLRDRLYFLEKIGDRWWPLAAAVYLLVAKKRVLGVTPLVPAWRDKRALRARATQPAAKSGLNG